MEYVLIFGSIIFGCALLSWSWVRGIDHMKENHPDYKGEDFLDWGKDDQPDLLSESSKDKIVEEVKNKGLYQDGFKKPNPKQFNGIKSDEPFVKTRKKKKRDWENEIDLRGSE
jgi:hypothetical protein